MTCLGILLTGCSGIRIGELCALKWEDIHFDTRTMHIGKTLQRIRTFQDNGEETGGSHATGTKITITSPKSSHSDREIPIPDFLLELLQRKRNQKGYLISGKKKEYTEPKDPAVPFSENPEDTWNSLFQFPYASAHFCNKLYFPWI